MFVPDKFKTNAYRVLRLSANATLSEIHKAGAGMRRAVALGFADATKDDIPLLGDISRTEADIRAAIGRLENPIQRLSDRLLWFHFPSEPSDEHPVRPSEAIPDNSVGAARGHDQALHGLLAAFEAGVDDAGVSLWGRSLRAWDQVVSDDDYWTLTLALEERGAFEPAALPSEIGVLRDDAVGLAAEALLMAARDALASDEISTVRRIMVALEELADTGRWAKLAQEDIAYPTVERLRALCGAVSEEFESNIVREQGAAKHNKSLCDATLWRFRSEIEPALDRLVQLVPPDHEAAQQSREGAARCLSGIAAGYTWADDFVVSEKLHEEALGLAHDTLGAIRIEHGLAQIREAARKQRVFGALTPISSAPSLQTINGFGFALYGKSDYDQETHSYSTTHYFVGLFVPIFPLGRYRVIEQGGRRYSFLGKLPLRAADRWHLGIAATAIVAMILIGVINSSQNSSSSYAPPANSSYGSRSPAPNPQSSQLSDLKGRIDSGRSRMTALRKQLQPVTEEVTNLKARMEPLETELKLLYDRHKSGIRIDIPSYNVKINTYNSMLARYQMLMTSNNTDLQTYDNLLKQDSVLVERYNALLR